MEPPDKANPAEPAPSNPEPAPVSSEHVPTRLERTLAQLVAAGVAQREHLAALLGLAPHHIARPLRNLTLIGTLEADPGGALRLTPAGRAWLGLRTPEAGLMAERAPASEVPAEEETGLRLLPPAPRLEALPLDDDRPVEVAVGVGRGRGGRTNERIERRGVRLAWPVPPIALPARLVAWPSGARLALRRLQLALSELCLGVAGVQLSPALSRRIAALAAASVVLVIGVRAGLPAWSLTGMSTFTPAVSPPPDQAGTSAPGQAAGTAANQPAGTAPGQSRTPQATPISSPPAVGPQPAERWVVVDHTNGLGLVLRSAPASPARVLTLQDGARIRVTGESVQQAGRAWLPVASQTGKTGWVAADFVTPSP